MHFVIEELDAGPTILQQKVDVAPHDTFEIFEEKIHQVEHVIYPQAISLFEQNKCHL